MIKICKLALAAILVVGIVAQDVPQTETPNTIKERTDKESDNSQSDKGDQEIQQISQSQNQTLNQSPEVDVNAEKISQDDMDENQSKNSTISKSAQNATSESHSNNDSENIQENQKNSDEYQQNNANTTQNMTSVNDSKKDAENIEQSKKNTDENQQTNTNINSSENQLNNTNQVFTNQTQDKKNQQTNNTKNNSTDNQYSENYSVFDQYELFDLEDLFNQEFKDDQNYSAEKIKDINKNKNNQTIPQENSESPKNKPQNDEEMEQFLKGLYEENFDDLFEFKDYQYYGDYGYYSGYDFEGIFKYAENLPEVDNQYDLFKDTEDVCFKNSKGEIVLNASMEICDVRLEGADKFQMSFQGGIDGVYELSGCHNGRPKYIRYGPQGQERVLWWSKFFGDWDINAGTEPDADNILCHGGQGHDEERPNFVNSSSWALSKLKKTNTTNNRQNPEKVFELIELNVTCTNGKSLNQPEFSKFGKQPLLTDEEMDYQYRMIYEKYSRQQPPQPQINGVLVIMVLFTGLGVLLGIPYLVVKRNNKKLNKNKNRNNKGTAVNKFKEYIDMEKQHLRKL
eukprot:TRINITY_DN18621_c0_g2_i1.p1 TRINITY_DN18621_c0_g2~~TRINITY_DN18621_c0_g2_i1.p1  ORF type:complete len:599 (+),score=91.73 TRINITY_DN18621_c0_g2_i1:91-1797(+)